MGTAYVQLNPNAAEFLGSVFPQRDKKNGTNIPVPVLWFDAALDEAAFWRVRLPAYSSGNITARWGWYADTASSGDVVGELAIAAITPNTDTQDIETDALATAQSDTDSHLGTTAQRLHDQTTTISNLDSHADGDDVVVRFRRLGSSSGSDTMSGDMGLVYILLSYTTA